MTYARYQYKILCEDRNQYNFVRGWLEARGAQGRRIQQCGELPHPGSGKDYVQCQFEMALKELRSRASYQKRVLIVVMDADNLTYKEAASHESFNSSKPTDSVFFIIPRWSIETWVRWLLEPEHPDAADESKSCKGKDQYRKAPFTTLGKKLAKNYTDASPDMPDSLKRTIAHVTDKIKSLAA